MTSLANSPIGQTDNAINTCETVEELLRTTGGVARSFYRLNLYYYYSDCARRHNHTNCSVSAPLNATTIAVMEGIHCRTQMVGPEFLFSI